MPNSSVSNLPLNGVCVIDFSHLMPAPWCTQTLGDLGADVIKIEQKKRGDPSRFNPPTYREDTVYFHSVNRNKRSINLDLNDAVDRLVLDRLIAKADIIVESYRPGVTTKLGINYESLTKTYPRLIYCTINGYGSEAPLANSPGHDAAIQSIAGLMHVDPAGVAPMPRIQTGDWAGAAYAAIAILAAYIRLQTTGKGVYIETAMYDALMSWSSIALSSALSRKAGFSGEPALQSFGANPRYATYSTADGKAVTACLLEASSWVRFCEYIKRSDLVYEETPADRHTIHPGRTELFKEAISNFCLSRKRDELAQEANDAGIAIVPVYTPEEALSCSFATARGVIEFMDHPHEGPIPFIADPLYRSGLSDPRRRPAPRFGENGNEIRGELGFLPTELHRGDHSS